MSHLLAQLSPLTRKTSLPSYRVVVGYGSNLGCRSTFVAAAVQRLRALPRISLLRQSQVRETEPVGGPEQGRYLNGALLLATDFAPLELLAILLQVEREFGRQRRIRWGPRTLDLDILWIEGVTVRLPTLVVPHPRLRQRRFALEPLLEVTPWATDPSTGQALATWLTEMNETMISPGLQPQAPM